MLIKPVVYVLFLLLLKTSYSQEFTDLVFSGFIELSADSGQNEDNADFSKIEVILTTEDNKLVEKTQCSSNGFYLLPVYDKKSYIIRVKPTLDTKFEPELIRLDLSKKTNEEIRKLAEESHNFRFVGFELQGQVLSEGYQTGPEELSVNLLNPKNQIIGETKTGDSGKFKFEHLNPGIYKLSILNSPDQIYTVDKANNIMECELDWKKAKTCEKSLIVTGYRVQGNIATENQSLESFIVFLYKQDTSNKKRCDLPIIKDHPLASKSDYYCYSKLDANGKFSIFNVENGDYTLQIHSTDKERKIEIEPETFNIVVSNGKVDIIDVFSVNRFSITGRVVDASGKGIENVHVSLDGEVKAISNNEGYYILEKVKAGTYTLEGNHDHLFFEPIHNLKLVASLQTLPNIVLSYLHVCGSVQLKPESHESPTEFQNVKVTIFLESKNDKRSTILEKDGTFCFEVKPGKYNVYPVVSNYEKSKDILLYPRVLEVKAFNEPVLDLLFYRPRLKIDGQVTFLKDVSPKERADSRILISSINQKFQQQTKILEDGTYNFGNILPGSYQLSVINDKLCWDKPSISIEINKFSDISGKNFEQSGYKLRYQAPKEISVKMIDPSDVSSEIKLYENENTMCVKKAGSYKFFPDNCYLFNQKNFTYDTRLSDILVFDPVKLLIKGQITMDNTILSANNITDPSLFTESIIIKLDIASKDGTSESNNIVTKIEKKEKNMTTYSYFYYVKPQSSITVTPIMRKSSKISAYNYLQNLLFYPEKSVFDVTDICIKNTPVTNFEIRPGLIFEGNITPEIDDLEISIYIDNVDNNKPIASIKTSQTKFKLGPFIDSNTYRIEAKKEGYKFEKVLNNAIQNVYDYTFFAQKLSTLKVFVEDETGKPISGVLIFITSSTKKNFQKLYFYTNETGSFVTNDIVRGEYLIRLVLKEYAFKPQQQDFKIQDGEVKELRIKATREMFSVFGKITNLNGNGVENLEVQAIPIDPNAHYPTENAITDAEGKYRIRGLIPGQKYRIEVIPNQNVLSIKPTDTSIIIPNSDTFDADFLMFEKPQMFSVLGSVSFGDSFLPNEIDDIETIDIYLYDNETEEPIQKKSIKLFRFYEFNNLAKKDYVIKVVYKRHKALSGGQHTEIIDENSFAVNHRVSRPIILERNVVKSQETIAKRPSFAAPIVILILIIGFFNLDFLQEIFKKYHSKSDTKKLYRKQD